jgi:hypothetical protein
MKKRNGGAANKRNALRTSGRRDFCLGFEPRFYRSVIIPFNNQFRFFHNPMELEDPPRRPRSRRKGQHDYDRTG